jgi:hypothetical protein
MWPLAWLAAALAAALAWHVCAPVTRWRLRHLPGPPAWPLLGNLPHMVRHGRSASLDAWAKQYGPLYKARSRTHELATLCVVACRC